MKFGFVIPVYNHGSTLEFVVSNLDKYNCPMIVVDDGNDLKNKEYISQVAKKFPSVTVVTLKKNSGKGKAMGFGIREAEKMGITHVLQIDSDGQHDTERVGYFIEKSKQNPEALICGYPEYDEDAPKKRVNGRKIANGWVHIVTLSNQIKDALIGFRIYPVKPYIQILNHAIIDSRMGYDTDILVHFSWKNIPIINEAVKVSYPKDGISNFRMFEDNIRIALTYTRLCVGMIIRLPVLLFRKIKNLQNKKDS